MVYPSALTFQVAAKTNGRCFYCNKMASEIDHFVPKIAFRGALEALGSPDELSNLVPSCSACNRKKRGQFPEDFMGNSYMAWDRINRANRRVKIYG